MTASFSDLCPLHGPRAPRVRLRGLPLHLHRAPRHLLLAHPGRRHRRHDVLPPLQYLHPRLDRLPSPLGSILQGESLSSYQVLHQVIDKVGVILIVLLGSMSIQ